MLLLDLQCFAFYISHSIPCPVRYSVYNIKEPIIDQIVRKPDKDVSNLILNIQNDRRQQFGRADAKQFLYGR